MYLLTPLTFNVRVYIDYRTELSWIQKARVNQIKDMKVKILSRNKQ